MVVELLIKIKTFKMKKYKLPKEFATKWLKALRSGEYTQIVNTLYVNEIMELGKVTGGEGYCCVGVAGVCLGIDKSKLTNHTHLLKSWCESIPDEMVGSSKLTVVLIDLNDNKYMTFPQIADWVEENCEFI